jgi:hypothetical protein
VESEEGERERERREQGTDKGRFFIPPFLKEAQGGILKISRRALSFLIKNLPL